MTGPTENLAYYKTNLGFVKSGSLILVDVNDPHTVERGSLSNSAKRFYNKTSDESWVFLFFNVWV
jgi:hypothetical protein